MYIYFFKSESCDYYINASEKLFDNIGQAMKYFEWDDYDSYIADGYTDEDMPYGEFECRKLEDIVR